MVAVLPVAAAPATADDGVRAQGTLGEGYWMVATDGGIFTFGNQGTGPEFYGSTGSMPLNKPIVGMAPTPTGDGYWLVASDGGIFNFGDADFFGSTGSMPLNKPIVGMASSPTGQGYYLVASDGGIFTFGDATFYGSAGGGPLNQPIVGMTTVPGGEGYYLVAADGGIFTYGPDAAFYGSTGNKRLNKPIVGMAAFPDGGGYWFVATDGGIFTFGANPTDGTTRFFGSQGSTPLNKPIVGMTPTVSGRGYWLVASDGGIFSHGDAAFYGSMGNKPLNKPIVGMAAAPFSPVSGPDFIVTLDGQQEVNPAVGNPDGDGDGTGTVFLDFSEDGDELCYAMTVGGIVTPTAAHIHKEVAGQNGDVVVTFSKLPGADGFASACQAISPALTTAIMNNPAGYYVNVHNADFPGGAIRGQLVGEVVVASTADNKVTVFDTEFAGDASDLFPFTGIGEGESIVGLDYSVQDDVVYVLTREGSVGRLYAVDLDLAAERVGGEVNNINLTGTTFGVDWDPVDEVVRIVSNANENITVNPDTGASTAGPALNGHTTITAIAYSNNNADATSSTLWAVDGGEDTVGTINEATGTYTAIGDLGIDVGTVNGFDIAWAPNGEPGTAILVGRTAAAETTTWAIDLKSGVTAAERVTVLGVVGDGDTEFTGATAL
ncbi:MAG TPA: DUF4394 domain-containing protein [Acidimicrobiales bacterium]